MLPQVHDEPIFESTEAEAEGAITAIGQVMENAAVPAVDMAVPRPGGEELRRRPLIIVIRHGIIHSKEAELSHGTQRRTRKTRRSR